MTAGLHRDITGPEARKLSKETGETGDALDSAELSGRISDGRPERVNPKKENKKTNNNSEDHEILFCAASFPESQHLVSRNQQATVEKK